MDHKRYEDWIFSDDELPTGDLRALHDHLTTCDRCYRLDRNWRAVRGTLRNAAPAGPSPGFSGRWQLRLEAENRRRRDRRYIVLFGAAFGTAALSFSMFSVRLIGGLVELGSAALNQAIEISGWIPSVQSSVFAAPALWGSLSPLLLALAVMGFFAALGAGAIAWLKMFRVLARYQGMTQWA